MTLGYFVGFICFKIFGYWELIYIIGFLSSYVGFYGYYNDIFEKISITSYFKKIAKNMATLTLATFFSKLLLYSDKLIIYPILGGASVSIYYVATVLGKVVSLITTPMNSVLLSHLSTEVINKELFLKKLLFYGSILSVVIYILIVQSSNYILTILYPQYVADASKYIPITSIVIIISSFSSCLNSFILKFYAILWQTIINSISLVIYIVLCLSLSTKYSLYGFCVGSLVSVCIKLIIMLCIIKFRKPNR